MVSECSKDTSNEPRVSKSHRSDWTSCLTYLESTFLLLGYLGVGIFVNKMLNSHVRPTRERTMNFLCVKLFCWVFGNNEDDLNKALLQSVGVRNRASSFLWLYLGLRLQHDKHHLPPTKPTFSYSSASPYKLHP